MNERFNRWWKFAQKWEGAYSNNPHDPGGETKWGISRRAHPEITGEDWANLTVDEAKEIAHADYWLLCHCDSMPAPFCYYVCDTAFNHGPDVALRLQQMANGPDDLLFLRIAVYAKLNNANLFFRGWVNRVLDLRRTFKEVA